MTEEQIIQKLLAAKKGRYVKLTKSKDLGNGLVKISDMRIRLGVTYANMSINEGRETGSLKWGSWIPGLENLALEHTNKKGEHNCYVRVTSIDPSNPESGADVLGTKYLLNGSEISKADAIAIADEKKMESTASPVYNINFKNIISIG